MAQMLSIDSLLTVTTESVDSVPGAIGLKDVNSGATVLVVDDDKTVAALFTRVLTAHGYAVRVADDGPRALGAVKEYAPDVVLLDVGLPRLNGVEVCRHLKREAATRLLPVVLMTGLDQDAHRIEGLEAGADDSSASR